jgi:hypothetical protein
LDYVAEVGYGFVDRVKQVAVLVTCGADLCRTARELRAVATFIHSRL